MIEKFGVPPASIPDWLALVGDAADGYPGVPRWGSKSACGDRSPHYGHIEAIPDRESEWRVRVRGAAALAASLREHRDEAYLYRRLATLRVDVPLSEQLDDLRWRGARREELTTLCREIEDEGFLETRATSCDGGRMYVSGRSVGDPTAFRTARIIPATGISSSSTLPSITTCLLKRPHSTNPRPR